MLTSDARRVSEDWAAVLFALDPAVLLDTAADAVVLVATPPVAAVEEMAAVPLATAEDVEFELAPVAAIRCSRSACVVQAILIPAELTRGSTAQLEHSQFGISKEEQSTYIRPVPQDWSTYLPPTHCAKES